MLQNNIATIISARSRDLGGLSVRRILPAIGRKAIGPFVFLDHMGPAAFAMGQGLDVRPHPHIGLATVTYLFEGAILHRDNLGSQQVIRPGDINWMVAGSGIVHSERTPADMRESSSRIDGLQCWVALPKEHEEVKASFHHHAAVTLPQMTQDGVSLRLLLGTYLQHQSPVSVYSDILYLDAKLPAGARWRVSAGERELGIYPVKGKVRVMQNEIDDGLLAVGNVGQDLLIEADADAHVVVLGGKPLPEERHIWWNFVSSRKERIDIAKADWATGRFPKVPGDEREFIPLPDEKPSAPDPRGTVM